MKSTLQDNFRFDECKLGIFQEKLPLLYVECSSDLQIENVGGGIAVLHPDHYLSFVGKPLNVLWPGIEPHAERACRGLEECYHFESENGDEVMNVHVYPLGEVTDDKPARIFAVGFNAVEQQQKADEIELLFEINRFVANSRDMESAIKYSLELICKRVKACYGEAWLPNISEDGLERSRAYFSTSDELAQVFLEKVGEFNFVDHPTLPLMVAWDSGKPVWMTEEEFVGGDQTAGFDRIVEDCSSYGVAIPILIEEKPIAVLQFCIVDSSHPEQRLAKILTSVSVQLGLFLARKRSEIMLVEYQNRLRELSIELIKTGDKERKRLAAALHDSAGVSLALARIRLNTLMKKSDGVLLEDHLNELREVEEAVRDAIQQTRSITYELSPHILYEVGLMAALKWLKDFISHRFDLEVEVDVPRDEPELPQTVAIMAFQMVRELLVNAGKHSGAKTVRVKAYLEKEHMLCLVVEDRGRGFKKKKVLNRSQREGGFGLFSIQERVRHMNGHFDVYTKPGKGAVFTIRLPVQPDETKEES